MGLSSKTLNKLFNLIGCILLISASLTYWGIIDLPHPEWATFKVRVIAPLIIASVLMLFQPKDLKGYLDSLIAGSIKVIISAIKNKFNKNTNENGSE